ncbi:MAG: CPBP family intramembrane metalloprotease [Chromatiaceae bacterium]|jgi:membrane protease YdiL (CAAX protease family)|nr:CPBP family intramembrane metalloprotease [Chromatiaceae bacterium]
MRETGVFFLFLVSCLVLGAFLTYPLMQTGWIEHDPHRIMGRLAQLFILLGLWPFLRALRLNNREALGYGVSPRRFLGSLLRGWLLGVAILLVLVSSLLLLEVRVPDVAVDGWLPGLLNKSIQALVGGLLTSLLEETFFRGALYSSIRRNGSARSAILWSSFLFALLHFMKPHDLPEGVPLDWGGAWQMFTHVFTGVFQWRHVDSMAALFLVGVFLAQVRERSGHIGWCIGLHAGWILVIQVVRYLTDGNQVSPNAWLAGDYDGVIGWLAAAWIGVLALGLWMNTRTRDWKPNN